MAKQVKGPREVFVSFDAPRDGVPRQDGVSKAAIMLRLEAKKKGGSK